MEYRGRKIYYDSSTGNEIIQLGEGVGLVETTINDDINAFRALSERNRDSFDVLELEYGQYAQDFAECNGYRVNPETKELEFSYPDPNEPEQPPVFQKALSEQIKTLELRQLQTNEDLSSLMDFIISGGM